MKYWTNDGLFSDPLNFMKKTEDEGMERRKRVLEEMLRGYAKEKDLDLHYNWNDNLISCLFVRKGLVGLGREMKTAVRLYKTDNLYTKFMSIKNTVDKWLQPSIETEEVNMYIRSDIKLTEAAYRNVAKSGVNEIYGRVRYRNVPRIEKVIFNYPATIVFWSDTTKTVVKCQKDDIYDPEKGLAMAIAKKALDNRSNYYNEIQKWLDEYYKDLPDISVDLDGSPLDRLCAAMRKVARAANPYSNDQLVEKAYNALTKDDDVNAAIGYLGEYLDD